MTPEKQQEKYNRIWAAIRQEIGVQGNDLQYVFEITRIAKDAANEIHDGFLLDKIEDCEEKSRGIEEQVDNMKGDEG